MIHHMVHNWGTVATNIDVVVCGGAGRSAQWSTDLYQHFRTLSIPHNQIFDGRTNQPAVIGTALGFVGRAVLCSPSANALGLFHMFLPRDATFGNAPVGVTVWNFPP
jgi:hypothetical protein